MLDLEKNCRVAVVQCSPVMFDKDATLANVLILLSRQVPAEHSLSCCRS